MRAGLRLSQPNDARGRLEVAGWLWRGRPRCSPEGNGAVPEAGRRQGSEEEALLVPAARRGGCPEAAGAAAALPAAAVRERGAPRAAARL